MRQEAEGGRVAIRNIRRDALGDLKDLQKEKLIGADEERRGQEADTAARRFASFCPSFGGKVYLSSMEMRSKNARCYARRSKPGARLSPSRPTRAST